MKFSDIGLGPEVLRAVEETGYETPTPIQEKAIPYVLQGRDVLGCAQTGTGKTASFTLPMIDILSQGRARARMPRSLILEPTRELAAQVAENFEVYGKHHKLNMALLIGGVSAWMAGGRIRREARRLRKNSKLQESEIENLRARLAAPVEATDDLPKDTSAKDDASTAITNQAS